MLKDITVEFKEKKNILINYSKSKFKEDGKIIYLNLEVDCNYGFKGTVKASDLTLKTQNFGFHRDYFKDTVEPFKIWRRNYCRCDFRQNRKLITSY